MAKSSSVRRKRVRSASFAVRFAVILLGVGLATALAAGAVAGYETERAANQQLVDDGHNTASLGAQLVRLDSAGSSAAFACEVASLGATQSAFAAGAAAAQTLAAQEASASTGQLVLFVAADGSVLGEAPTVLARAQLADLRSSLGGGVGCSGSKAGGFFWRPAQDSLYGVGAARVSRSGLELGTVIVLTRVVPATVNFARRLAQIDAPSAKLLVVAGGRILVGPAVPGLLSGAGSRLPGSLAAVLKSSRSRGTIQVKGNTLAAAGVALSGADGGSEATLLALQPRLPYGPSIGQIAVPLALAVAAILLLGMLLVFLLAERYLNRPLRRLNEAVQRLGQNGYAEPVQVEGAEEITRLSANFEIMRRQLRHQLLMATGRSVIAATLTGNIPLEQALTQVLANLRGLLEVQMAMILVRSMPMNQAGYLITSGVPDPALDWPELEAGQGMVARLVREPRFVARALLTPSERGDLERRINLRDCLAVPLRVEGRDIGVLIIGNKHRPYQEEDHSLCQAVADQVVVSVEKNTRLAASQREATTDAMTGLYNYRFLVGYLDQQVNVAERSGASLTVLMLDLDHFKGVNDTYGHPAGDQLLRAFAALLVDTIRRSDLAARYGGEEFVVVMANTRSADARLVAEKIRAAAEQLVVRLESGAELRLTVSIGGVSFPEGSRGARNLLDLADRALYVAKRGGRNRVEFLDLAAVDAHSEG